MRSLMPPKYLPNAKLIKPNPFKLKQVWRHIDGQQIQVGDYVSVSWDVAEAYGGGKKYQKGVLKELHRESGWFEIAPSNSSPGHLRGFIYAMGMNMLKITDELEIGTVKQEIEARQPKTKPRKVNPFIIKAGKQ